MSKVMSVNELIDLLNGKVEVTTEGALAEGTATGLISIYESNLPDGITTEIVNKVHTYDGRFFEAFGTVGAEVLAVAARANDDLAAAELKFDVQGHSMSVAFSRPVAAEPSDKEWRAAIGFGYGVGKPNGLDKKVRKAFAEAMLAGDDDE